MMPAALLFSIPVAGEGFTRSHGHFIRFRPGIAASIAQ